MGEGLIQVATIVVLASLEMVVHWYIIEKLKTPINHKIGSLIRGVVLTVFVFLHGFGLLLLLPLYWVIFHYGLNILREKELSYLGTNWFDNLLFEIDLKIGAKKRMIYHLLTAVIGICLNLIL